MADYQLLFICDQRLIKSIMSESFSHFLFNICQWKGVNITLIEHRVDASVKHRLGVHEKPEKHK